MIVRFLVRLPALMLAVASLAAATRAEEPSPAATADAAKAEHFTSKVEPILTSRCLKCHGGEKTRGGLRLDGREAMLKGGDLGPAVDLDAPDESLLLKAIRYEDGLEMPPSGRLPDDDVKVLAEWLAAGAPWSGGDTAGARPTTSEEPDAPTADSWPYREVVRPEIPTVRDRSWARNPVDAFLLAGLEADGLAPAPEADRRTLIRRATFDLTGLPPTPAEIEAFEADPATDAFERLVDRLLASPQYGEAWGRHWLDLVRYAETNGYERDAAKPFIWRYRDYVVDAFNHDKPYDRFLLEQLAGDEVAPDSVEAQVATGFYRLGVWDDEPADRPLARFDMLDGVVSTVGQVFLGMTINCARCHDHKKDPIPQSDYYRLLAFFIDMGEQTGLETRKVGPEGVAVMAAVEKGRTEPHVLLRGNPNLLGPRVEPGVPVVLDPDRATFGPGAGKRRALAEWLADRRNPMTARVFANRLWQYHFGRGLVPSPNDFGSLGDPSTHPELLDWLAAELMGGGWTVKRMHRIIMLSSAYRMSSRPSDAALARDPANLKFQRFPMRRLTAEEVRDAILAVGGVLNPGAKGPWVCPPIPDEVLAGQSVPGQGWKVSSPEESARRSLYVHIKRSLAVPILATHDAADTDSSCPVRYTTTVPTQALGLLNGAFANEHAAKLAGRLAKGREGDLEAQVREAVLLTTGREPTADEAARDLAFLHSLRDEAGLSEAEALVQYALLALNANAFLYLD
ncbi:PSD1 and planctomycete cytochrome C domain-containing protein [Planctomyces sp. SH-PL62]|uniref:PSD1 and planctomycete cytochrome C domain-containing protein n=1 Tax=Planctomyces sp. SH-PL62 TaxID=1636152 RepID=UPI00078B40E2|nr:PSD1 and planctomycete cytochrome C domain-containing protein [Planctomyces sp. SH-PL62]AMV39727.1 Planctomycete cytochrome C [Planctomyces sp. SH-PL62]